MEDHRAGGLALAVGYGLLIVVLFRDPSSGLATATGSVRGTVLFVLVPVAGLLSGGYVFGDLPFRAAVAFVTGSYLAMAGLALALLPTELAAVTTLLGLVLFGLGALALVVTLRSAVSALVPDGSY